MVIMETKILLRELSSDELFNTFGGDESAERMGEAIGHMWGSALKMFLFCAAIQSGVGLIR